MTSKLVQELNRATGQKYAVRDKWETRKAETERHIEELEEKMSSPEVLEDYKTFTKLSSEISESQSYLEQIETMIRKETNPNETEKKAIAAYKEKTLQECKSVHAGLCNEVLKETKKILPMIEAAEAEQRELLTALNEYVDAFSGDTTDRYSITVSARQYDPEYDRALKGIKTSLFLLSERNRK